MLNISFPVSFTSIKGCTWDGERKYYLSIPDDKELIISEHNGKVFLSTNPDKEYKNIHIETVNNNCSVILKDRANVDIGLIDYGCNVILKDHSHAEILEMQGINWPGYTSSLRLQDNSTARVNHIKGETDNTDHFCENEIDLSDNSKLKIDSKCERANIYLKHNSELKAEDISESYIEQYDSSKSTISSLMGRLELRGKSSSNIKTTQRYKNLSAIQLYDESGIQINTHNGYMKQYDYSESNIDVIKNPESISLYDNSHSKIKTVMNYDVILEGKTKADIESEKISIGKKLVRFFKDHI